MDMGKKPQKPSKNVPVGEPGELTHHPFAGLVPAAAAAPIDPTGGGSSEREPPPQPGVARRGRLVLARETKHRGGKPVVVVRGFDRLSSWTAADVEQLAKQLKRALGCGGSVQHTTEIIVQGDRPAQVAAWLRDQGFRVEGVTS